MKVLKFNNNKSVIERMNKDNDIKSYINLFQGEKMLIIENTKENIELFKEETQPLIRRKPYTIVSHKPKEMMKVLGTEKFCYLKADEL